MHKLKSGNKVILDLCGGTGAWAKPYRDAGYDVRLITLPEYDVRAVDFGSIWFTFFGRNGAADMRIEPSEIYGILAAPPCTEFSKAKSTKPREFKKGLVTIEACLKIIWHVQLDHKLAFWALENPMGLLRRFLGKPPYTFNQWWFGEYRTKTTDLWGYFNDPKRLYKSPPMFLETTKGYKGKDGREIKTEILSGMPTRRPQNAP